MQNPILSDFFLVGGESETARKIRQFGDLPVGWHFGSGKPVAKKAIQTALALESIAASIGVKSNVFPGLDGDMALSIYRGRKDVTFEISATGEIALYSDTDPTVPERDDLCLEAAQQWLIRLIFEQWSSSSFSTHLDMTPIWKEDDIRVSLSSRPKMAAVFPLSAMLALPTFQGEYVITAPPTILQDLSPVLLHSGASTRQTYLPDRPQSKKQASREMYATTT